MLELSKIKWEIFEFLVSFKMKGHTSKLKNNIFISINKDSKNNDISNQYIIKDFRLLSSTN